MAGFAKGFFSFVIASVFLLALVSSASGLLEAKRDSSNQKFISASVEDIAIKQALYKSASDSASQAAAAARISGTSERAAARAAVHIRLLGFQDEMRALGYDFSLWCGDASSSSRQAAAEKMAGAKSAEAPAGALPLSPLSCADSFDIDPLLHKIHFSGMGFSVYSARLGFGYSSPLPSGYEVDYT